MAPFALTDFLSRSSRAPSSLRLGFAVLFSLLAACSRPIPQSSVILAVLDTTRADAVSAYGQVAGTTPTVDALARTGLQYDRAYSNAGWTLPAHASLFTGLLPSEHGVQSGSDKLDTVLTLAEALQRAGYETIGIVENPWLTPTTGMARGFERFAAAGTNMTGKVEDWLRTRDGNRPFFLFLNIMDPHSPYEVRDTNPFLPAGIDTAAAKAVSQAPDDYLCLVKPGDRNLAALRGLYLGDVHAADAKLAAILARIEPLRARRPQIVIVTSDHGEYFGEHGLVGHYVGVAEAVLRVPLIVHGLPYVRPARIASVVQLLDLMPSILAWVGAPVPGGLTGRPLPTKTVASGADRVVIAEHHDYFRTDPHIPEGLRALANNVWRHCGPDDRVLGDMRSLIRFPEKVVWYANYAPELFDVAVDPLEEHNLASASPEKCTALQAELATVIAAAGNRPPAPKQALDPALVERLRGLGYLGGAKDPKPAHAPQP